MNRNLVLTLLLLFLSNAFYQPVLNAADVELVPSSRVILKISEDMTIDDIIRRIYPRDKDLWPQIKAKLIETNPYSFVQYSDRLIPGLRLKLVDIKRVYEQEESVPKVKVGYVAQLNGQATSRGVDSKVHQLQINSRIFEGDRLETGEGARLYILMDDGAEVHLKEDSALKISEYVISAGYGKDSSSILDLIRGGLRKITGSIGSSSQANYQVQTGFATIGIRGTEYVIKLCKQDDCTQNVSRNDPDAKLHAVVLKGAISVSTDDDIRILMAMGEYGTATPEVLVIEDEAPVPAGLLDTDEVQSFSKVEMPKSQAEEQSSASPWVWIIGLLMLAVGI